LLTANIPKKKKKPIFFFPQELSPSLMLMDINRLHLLLTLGRTKIILTVYDNSRN
jgi:hypothetical protein